MWAAVCFSADEEERPCAIQNLEAGTIEMFFETVQAQISNFEHRDYKIYGFEEAMDWTSGQWRDFSRWAKRIATQLSSRAYILHDSVLCLGGKCQEHLEAAKTWKMIESEDSPEARMSTISRYHRKPSGVRVEG